MAETSKLKLLQVLDLNMAEIVEFETMSGLSVTEVLSNADKPMPYRAVMALAYLTEKRLNPRAPGARKAFWDRMSFTEFNVLLYERFEFAEVEDDEDTDGDQDGAGDGDGEDPTTAG